MSPDDENIPILDADELPRAEPARFSPDQMVRCEACLRASPPTRTSCLYCGAPLPLTEASAALRRPALRKLEKWEQGFNHIFLPDSSAVIVEESLGEMAELLRLEPEELRGILATGEPLPLARVATFDEASLIERRLGALGVRSLIISDQDLALDTSPAKRMRAFEFTDGALLGYAVGGMETLRIPWEDILLFVAGRHHLRQVEVEERPGRGPEGEMLEARELSADEALLDLYTAQRDGGWRIAAHGFDFSCLGQQKSLLAAENFKNLTDHLRERAWRAAYDDSYMRLRHALAQVWPPEQSTESRGWRRELPGRYSTEAITTSDNERQFTRYSRLRHHLKLRQSGSNV